MPRFFVTTASDRFVARDDEGVELPTTEALHSLMCATLASMLSSEADHKEHRQDFTVHASDAEGNEVLSATLELRVRRP